MMMQSRELAHKLIDRMAPGQIAAVVGLLEIMLDPLAHTLAGAACDDEPLADDETDELAAARAALSRGETVSHDEVLKDFGLTQQDFERMGRAPLDLYVLGS